MALLRADKLLQRRSLASSRTQAQDLIDAGQVFQKKNDELIPVEKSSQQIDEDDEIIVKDGPIGRYVSRGGLKLEGALRRIGKSPEGLVVLDVGQSTGGFTDCLLRQRADGVVGIDVGHGQLHESLRADPRVQAFEGLHLKDLDKVPDFISAIPTGGFSLIVVDVSFISLTVAIFSLKPVARSGGEMLALVKPQFEVGVENLDGSGIVKDPSLMSAVENKIRESCRVNGWTVLDYFESDWTGKDGNREFFIHARKN